MDIEFHYYMTYLIAVRAGLSAVDAQTLAYASQYVDDNDMILEIDKGDATAYRNYISQTMNILKPKKKLFRIYPLFHFIPGDPKSKTAFRKDGKMHWLNTTPNSKNANRILDAATGTGNLYRIGVACHCYADTWAHQNFTGYYDGFNAMEGPLGQITPNIGHADAVHNPDWPALVWRDKRLLNERRDNKAIFLDAAKHIFKKLMTFADPTVSRNALAGQTRSLLKDLEGAIGDRDQGNEYKKERIKRYRRLCTTAGYKDTQLTTYDSDAWIDQAIHEDVRGLRDRSDFTLARLDPFQDHYTWADRTAYQDTHWYRFQEAVKAHQDVAWEILSAANLKGLELPEF